ncbi:hypothetical protein WAF17_02760 [Bernardetia sp. ABR2-2B]|uniref:hypothetical protein n=1 Tax=Bernardetia sp. ABR2-2B TaxID=3127472 RepID=UPI0030CF70CD
MISTQTIFLREALKQMNARDEDNNLIPFSLRLYTADRKNKTGGQLLYFENCVISKLARLTELQKKYRRLALKDKTIKANHWENSTRNILLLNSGEIRTVHIRLITHFNSQKIIW